MENKDIFEAPETAPTWRWGGGGFWEKNVKKNFIGRDVNNHIDLERAKKDY